MNSEEYVRMFETEDTHWWYVSLHNLILSLVAREITGRPLDILDAGCGTGRLCQLMNAVGSVRGCDASETALQLCASRGLSCVFPADLNSAELGRGRYDIITSIDVLYHAGIRDDVLVMKKFLDALKPGGLLILNLPAFEFLRSRHDIAVHTGRRYTKKSLTATLRVIGFQIEKASYRVCLLFPAIAAYRLAQKLFPGPATESAASDVTRLPAPLNGLLLQLAKGENAFIESIGLPFGSSVFVTARKPS